MIESSFENGKKRIGRKRLPKEKRRSEILAAAERVFSVRGYEAATIAEVAGLADTAEGNVYRYFETKRELLAQVISNWYEATILELEQKTREIPDARDRLEFLIRYHIRALKHNPGLLGLIIREVRTQNDAYEAIIGNLNRRYTGFLSQAVRDGIETGAFRRDIPASLVRDMIFGCIEHNTWRYLAVSQTSEIDVEEMTERILAVIRSGIELPTDARTREDFKRQLGNHVDQIGVLLKKI